MDSVLQKSITNEKDRDIFLNDVITGLSKAQKKLHSKYFYDEKGEKLFQKIMEIPEYYITDCEMNIFKNKTAELSDYMIDGNPFEL